MIQGLINFLVGTLGFSQEFAERRVYDLAGAIRLIFWGTLIVPLLIIFIGAAFNALFFWQLAGYMALINVTIGALVLNAPAWAVLLIWKVTSDEAAAALKKFVLPLIFWVGLVASMLYAVVPIEQVSVGDILLTILLVTTTSLGFSYLGGDSKTSVRMFTILVVVRLLLIPLEMFFPGLVTDIVNNFVTPVTVFIMTTAKDGFIGAIWSLVALLIIISLFYAIGKKKNVVGWVILAVIIGFLGYWMFPGSTPGNAYKEHNEKIYIVFLPDPEVKPSDYYFIRKILVHDDYKIKVDSGSYITSTTPDLVFYYENNYWGDTIRFSSIPPEESGRYKFAEDGYVYFTRNKGEGDITATVTVVEN